MKPTAAVPQPALSRNQIRMGTQAAIKAYAAGQLCLAFKTTLKRHAAMTQKQAAIKAATHAASVLAHKLARVHQPVRVQPAFERAHNIPRGPVFAGHIIQLAHTDAMFTGCGAAHAEGALNHPAR